MFNVKFWKQEGQVIKWDVLEYYGYLPAYFIYNDLSLEFTRKAGEDWGKKIWALTAPNGNKVFKMSMGMSLMYAPFFGAAHAYTKSTGQAADDGYSSPYKFALLMSCIFYLFFGLYFLRLILLQYFNDLITGFTLIATVAGTNLWYYASFEAPLSHSYSFSLIAVFIWLVIQFYKSPNLSKSIYMGLTFGLICLIRPSNAIVGLLFILYGVTNYGHFKQRILYLFSNYKQIFIIGLSAIIVWVPQLLYWKMQTGQYFYFSYAENGAFYFSNPHIIDGLFSYRKGWFLYTPLMLFAMFALPLTWKSARNFSAALLIFIPLNIFIIFSWWCWWYGGCFGQRGFIDSFALMAIPLACLVKWILDQRFWPKIGGITVILLSVLISIFHTAKYYYGSIHWDSMTKEAYWESLTRLRPGPDFHKLLKEPDYEKALKGEDEY
jgi:hypothetical protein